jgi:hypothetical protein
VAAIVDDICAVVRNYFRRPDELEPGQLTYLCPAADGRMSRSLLKIGDGPSRYATSSFSHEGVTAST